MATNQIGKQLPTSEALRRRKNPRCEPTFEPLRCCTAWRRPGRAESPTNRGTDGLPAALLKYCNNAREQSCPLWPPNARGHNSSLHACIMKREQCHARFGKGGSKRRRQPKEGEDGIEREGGEGALERGRKEGEGYRERRVGKGWGGEGNGGRGKGGDGRGGRGAEGVGRRRRTPAPSSDLKPKPCPSASDGGPKRANCGSQV